MNPRTRKILMWVCIGLLSLHFAFNSFNKLTGAAEPNFIRWGYNLAFMYTIGFLEVLGAIGLWIPKLRKWAAVGLVVLTIGAVYTHLTHHEAPHIALNLMASLLALGIILFSRR